MRIEAEDIADAIGLLRSPEMAARMRERDGRSPLDRTALEATAAAGFLRAVESLEQAAERLFVFVADRGEAALYVHSPASGDSFVEVGDEMMSLDQAEAYAYGVLALVARGRRG